MLMLTVLVLGTSGNGSGGRGSGVSGAAKTGRQDAKYRRRVGRGVGRGETGKCMGSGCSRGLLLLLLLMMSMRRRRRGNVNMVLFGMTKCDSGGGAT